jgi:hypothetical protein
MNRTEKTFPFLLNFHKTTSHTTAKTRIKIIEMGKGIS